MVQIQGMTPVGKSLVWDLLRQFYLKQGPKAWSNELVPQGATANCYTADTYAGIVTAFFRDLETKGCDKKPIIIELGGGNGRFAWQFLNRLKNYHLSEQGRIPAFTYLLTDVARDNIDSWKRSKRLGSLVEDGVLEFGELWVDENPVIKLDIGTISAYDLRDRPVVFIANYLFDTIPTDMVHIRDHKLHRVYMALHSEDPDFQSKPLETFEGLSDEFSSTEIVGGFSGHETLDKILAQYAEEDGDFYAPVSIDSFRFLEAFIDRDAPLLMIAADIAFADISDFELKSPFIYKSYFAHYTNFHLLAQLFKLHHGDVVFQRHLDTDFCCGAFLTAGGQSSAGLDTLTETRRAAAQLLREFNPYDAHELIMMLQEGIGEATLRQVAAWLRFSKMDPHVAQACLPLLFEELEQGQSEFDNRQLYELFMEAYQSYFPDGSPDILDYGIAQLLLAIQFNEEALDLLEASIAEFGEKPARLYVYALALIRLDRMDDARAVLDRCLKLDSQYGPAIRLIEEKFSDKHVAEVLENAHLRVNFSDPNVLEKAGEIFGRTGAVLIDQIIHPDLVQQLRDAFYERVVDWKATGLGTPNNVGDKRFTFPIRMRPPFSHPTVFANPVLVDMLTDAMGARPVLHAFGAVVTYNGARMQHIHREHPLLFSSDEANRGLPTYAVTVLIPLVDLDETLGGTQLWEGTHKLDAETKWQGDPTIFYTPAGGALVFDYRVYHGGMPCSSDSLRPLLYFTYSLPWFVDTLAFDSHAALGVSASELEAIDKEHRDLLRFAKRISD